MKQTEVYIYSLAQGYVNIPALCHKIVWRDLDLLDILQNFTLIYHINDILLIGQVEQNML